MPLESKHSTHTNMLGQWAIVNDFYSGELAVKNKGENYLPPTSAHRLDGYGTAETIGTNAYNAYVQRAIVPELVSEAVEKALGDMHRKPPVIELPAAMESMREHATMLGDSMPALLRIINREQLLSGRLGILGDFIPDDTTVVPFISLYVAESIGNWYVNEETKELALVVLDESRETMNEALEWETVERYRVAMLGNIDEDGGLVTRTDDKGNPVGRFTGEYLASEGEPSDELESLAYTCPKHLNKPLERIPFSFINAENLAPDASKPPSLGLALQCMAIYRAEADYRHTLFMQGQETLVRIGVEKNNGYIDNTEGGTDSEADALRTGSSSHIDLPEGGDAKYIGIGAKGLGEQRSALENDYRRAAATTSKMNAESRAQESGEAIRLRQSAASASFHQIALAGAAGLEQVLKTMAPWFGANADEVKITPNTDFTDSVLDGQTLVSLMTAKGLGAPLSEESIHKWLADQGATEFGYEEEREKIRNGQESEL